MLIENETDKDYDPLIQTAIEGYFYSTKGYQVATRSLMEGILEEQGVAVQDFFKAPMMAIETGDGEPVDSGFLWGFEGSDEKSGAWPADRDQWTNFRASNPGQSLGESDQCWAELKRRSPTLSEGHCWSAQRVQTRFKMEEP